ncbi:DNA polymerase III alpha subunit [Rhodovulum sp. PH10]|uniref:DNA polymerase III subunit alpha n=1 Tax=Rhodovulum sp. PH10 TaxID=1187851 RepID=UPI00027C2520|nr:DNA polymerase III subunit alpha [Rhodovulum sp. PH10]EJW11849.1 DNA polymerase III alpha subunit [Rhodovulum sp. PH10]
MHLHVHSAYSLLEGALPVGKLYGLAKADRQPALALTDTDNLFGALEFSEKVSAAGIQPIVGISLAIDFADHEASRSGPHGGARSLPRLVLLAAREEGYRNLMRLNSRAFLDTPSNEAPHIAIDWLAEGCDGLIALTGGPDGPLNEAIVAGQLPLLGSRFEALQSLFGDRLYIELQRHGTDRERAAEGALIDLAYARGVPLVATNQPFFATADDYEAHDALLCIAEGRMVAEAERRHLTSEHRFKTRAEMAALFSDLPEALASTVEIAQRCAFRPRTRKPLLPRYSTDEADGLDEETIVRRRAAEGLDARLAAHGCAAGHTEEDYRERLAFELDIISRMKFPGYFLIVSDFIQWAKRHGIPVGPGRGSGAGSVVAWALTITDLDPLRFNLLFERFLNPERVSMPDFDVDFCQNRRDEVIRYVQQRYGRENVAQIITFGTLQARGVLRDVGRVLEMPYGQVDKLCKLVPQNPAKPISLAEAIESEPKLQAARDTEPVVARAFAIAKKLEGLNRHASTHAAGIVIGHRRLDELVPLYRDPKSDMPVTQFNMKWVEQAGLVKFDFLGLKTLTTLDTAVKLLKRRGIEIDLAHIPLDDKKSYEMLTRGETVGVFQVESAGMRRALVDMRPDRLEDIVALVALYRPGPMANIPIYCARKHGYEKPDYIHPKLEPYLRETFGVIIYQEQVMQIAQALAGYSLGEADLLRRAMGKKIRAEMDKQRIRFVSGAVERGVEKAQADTIFDLLAKFADYGFNKSHAAAYALVSYQTAYLKANFPVEFLAASMTLDMGNTEKLSDYRAEAGRLGITLAPPSVNRSGVDFDVEGNTIFYALAAIKGIGRQAVETIVSARGEKPFADLADFARRIDPRQVNKRVLESLVAAGAFDCIERDRARAFAAIETIMATAQRTHAAAESGQSDMFGGPAAPEPFVIPPAEIWLPAEKLQREYDAIGFFLTGHPLDDYAHLLKRLRLQTWGEFSRAVRAGATAGRLGATVVSRTERRTKTGNKMGIIGLSDPSGHYEAVLFSEGLQQYRDFLEPGKAVLLFLSAEAQGEEVRARIQTVEPLDEAAAKQQKGLRIFLRDEGPLDAVAKRLEQTGGGGSRTGGPGQGHGAGGGGRNDGGDVSIVLLLDEAEIEVKLKGRYKVSPQTAGALKAVPGVVEVQAV